jgi:hypothetical protein
MPFLSQNIMHMIFPAEVVCLNFNCVGDEVCLHSMDCCFDLGALCDIHVLFPTTIQLKPFSPSSLYCVRKFNILACWFNSCSSVSIFGTNFAHNFWNLNYQTQFREEVTMEFEEMQGKWHNDESSVLSNLRFNCMHQIFIHNSWPLHRSSCTFSRLH